MSLVDGDHTTGGYNALNTKYITSALTKVAVCVLYVLQTTYAKYAESASRPIHIETSGRRDVQLAAGASQFSVSSIRSISKVKSARYLFLGCHGGLMGFRLDQGQTTESPEEVQLD